MKKIIAVLLLTFFLFPIFSASGQEIYEETTIQLFWKQGCPSCAEAKDFLKELEEEYPQLTVEDYEFSRNIELIQNLYQEYDVPAQEQALVPVIFTKEKYFIGFSDQTSREIEQCIEECSGEIIDPAPQKVKIPFLGQVNTDEVSIPLLAIALGVLDGFNICSLGAMVLILGLILSLKSRKRILVFGGIFLLTTVISYGVLVFLWNRLFVFLVPYIRGMEILIGILALIGAFYFLREFLKARQGKAVCQFGGISEKLSGRIQKVFQKKSSIAVLVGAIFLFAVIVTIIEFPCTAFFPVLFAGILAKAELSTYLSLLYIGLYIFFYMLDELIILLVAVFTFRIWIVSPKFVSILNLIASILLLFLGSYYFFGLLN